MGERRRLDSAKAEQEAASYVLGVIEKTLTKDDNTMVRTPIVRLAEMALEEIQKHGGKVSASLIGLLSNSENLADIQIMLNEQGKKDEYFRDIMLSHQELAGNIANELLDAGLVELPVISRGRGFGK